MSKEGRSHIFITRSGSDGSRSDIRGGHGSISDGVNGTGRSDNSRSRTGGGSSDRVGSGTDGGDSGRSQGSSVCWSGY